MTETQPAPPALGLQASPAPRGGRINAARTIVFAEAPVLFLIGVLYLLGYASEEGRKPRDAAAYYHRVFAIDIDFRDVGKRLKQMGKAASK